MFLSHSVRNWTNSMQAIELLIRRFYESFAHQSLFFFPPNLLKIFFNFLDLHLATTVLIFLHHVPCKSAIGNPRGQTETSLGQQKWDPGGKLSYVLFLIFATPSKAIIFRPLGHVHVIIKCTYPIKGLKKPEKWNYHLLNFYLLILEKFGPFLASLLA